MRIQYKLENLQSRLPQPIMQLTMARSDTNVDPAADLEFEDRDLLSERSKFKVRAWRRRINADTTSLYGVSATVDLWSQCGHDIAAVRQSWLAQTMEWVRKLLSSGTSDGNVERLYEKYVAGFHQINAAMMVKKRTLELEAAVVKHAGLLQPSRQITGEALVALAGESEGLSAIFYVLRERPDLVQSARRDEQTGP